MKIAYRIITPVLALGAIAMSIFLEMFNFTIGSTDSQIDNLVSTLANLAQNLGANINTNYGFSVYTLISMLSGGDSKGDPKELLDIIKPIMPQIVTFLVIMFIIVGIFIAIAVCSAAIGDKKKRHRSVYFLSLAGFVLIFVNIIVTNNAFGHITGGDIDITALVKLFSDSTIAALATAILSVTKAVLSAGFYAMFGMFILIDIWTLICSYVIASPIVPAKKAYKRKKPVRNPFIKMQDKKN